MQQNIEMPKRIQREKMMKTIHALFLTFFMAPVQASDSHPVPSASQLLCQPSDELSSDAGRGEKRAYSDDGAAAHPHTRTRGRRGPAKIQSIVASNNRLNASLQEALAAYKGAQNRAETAQARIDQLQSQVAWLMLAMACQQRELEQKGALIELLLKQRPAPRDPSHLPQSFLPFVPPVPAFFEAPDTVSTDVQGE